MTLATVTTQLRWSFQVYHLAYKKSQLSHPLSELYIVEISLYREESTNLLGY